MSYKTRYDFEIKNDLGSVNGTITLEVNEDYSQSNEETSFATEVTNTLESLPVELDKFGTHVLQLHLFNNRGFVKQYEVTL